MSTVVDAWQAALAAEQRATFGYGLLGPHVSRTDQALAIACSDAHEQLRNRLVGALTAAKQTPVAAAADYPDLYPVTSADTARQLAARLEDDCAAAWRYLYLQAASSTGPRATALRASAQAGLNASAVRATKWRLLTAPDTASTPFPGIV